MKQEKKEDNSGKGLERNLGIFSVFSICTGAAFSSGFFLLPGMALDITGPVLPLVYFVAGVLMLPAILSISELSAAMPRSGGPYFFVTRSLGPLLGMIGALGKFIQLILKSAFAFVGVGIYLSLLFSIPVQTVTVILIILFTSVNLIGVRQTATTEKILVVILLIILTYFLAAGVTEVFAGNIDLKEQFHPLTPFGWEGFISGIALVFISFGGVAQVASVAEEVKKPARTFPKGILLSLAVSSFFYLLGTALMIALLSSEALRGDETPAATAARQMSTLPLPVTVMVIAALAAFASTGNAAILSASRYPLALARDGLSWQKFKVLSKKGVPTFTVLLSGALTIALVLLLNVKEIAKTASAFLLFVFVTMCLAVIIFRESGKREYQPKFKSPLYPWLQIAGCVIYTWLILVSGLGAIAFIAGVFIVGTLWYYFGLKEKPQLSAAVYYLFGRIASKGSKTHLSQGANLSVGGTNFASVVESAIYIRAENEISFEDAVKKAAEALRERLGGKKSNIEEGLLEEVRHWKNPVKFDISIAPALLGGIEQPEMIVIKGDIHVEDRNISGLIVLVDDENFSSRLLQLLAQVETSINHHDFAEAWQNAEKAGDVKKALIQDVRSFTIWIRNEEPTKELQGKKIQDISLPEHCIVGAMYRNGKIMVPKKEEVIKNGDELIIIAQGDALETLSERFSENIVD